MVNGKTIFYHGFTIVIPLDNGSAATIADSVPRSGMRESIVNRLTGSTNPAACQSLNDDLITNVKEQNRIQAG